MDPRTLGRPRTWYGYKLKSRRYNVSILGFVGALGPLLLKMMKVAGDADREIDLVHYAFSDNQVVLNAGLY